MTGRESLCTVRSELCAPRNEIISMDDVETISKNFLQLDLSGDGALWTKDALAWELQRLLQPKKKKQAAVLCVHPHSLPSVRQILEAQAQGSVRKKHMVVNAYEGEHN